MLKLNTNYFNIEKNYLFAEIEKQVKDYIAKNENAKLIRLGIGDVTLPICNTAVNAMVAAAKEMGNIETFRGYGPYQGYEFLRDKISGYYLERGVRIDPSEIFVGDGAKSDIGNILEIFSKDCKVAVPDPVYPVYVDTNTMDGREITYLAGNSENGFLPLPYDGLDADIIYICSPNNPTGAVYDREGLASWVDYAISHGSVILFDAAYEAFVGEGGIRSIFEIEGARKCAIEFCSLSKTAGFTGLRCGYTVIPQELVFGDVSLNQMWFRRQTTKYNGESYIIQRGAEAVFTPEGQREIKEAIAYYKENARIITKGMAEANIEYFGGDNSPYIWLKCPDGMTSWDFFHYLLENANVVGTPGSGFGKMGEGYFRLTAFGQRENVIEAVKRIEEVFGSRK